MSATSRGRRRVGGRRAVAQLPRRGRDRSVGAACCRSAPTVPSASSRGSERRRSSVASLCSGAADQQGDSAPTASNDSQHARPLRFASVHRLIGSAQQVRGVLGFPSDTESPTLTESPSSWPSMHHGMRELGRDPFRDVDAPSTAPQTGEQNGELVAAVTRDEVVRAHDERQAVRDRDEHVSPVSCPNRSLISLKWSTSTKSTATTSSGDGGAQHLVEPLEKEPPVREMGDRVVLRVVQELLLRDASFADVAHVAHVASDRGVPDEVREAHLDPSRRAVGPADRERRRPRRRPGAVRSRRNTSVIASAWSGSTHVRSKRRARRDRSRTDARRPGSRTSRHRCRRSRGSRRRRTAPQRGTVPPISRSRASASSFSRCPRPTSAITNAVMAASITARP